LTHNIDNATSPWVVRGNLTCVWLALCVQERRLLYQYTWHVTEWFVCKQHTCTFQSYQHLRNFAILQIDFFNRDEEQYMYRYLNYADYDQHTMVD